MKLNDLIGEFQFDKRITEWGMRHNNISQKEYEEYLKSLPDLSAEKDSITKNLFRPRPSSGHSSLS